MKLAALLVSTLFAGAAGMYAQDDAAMQMAQQAAQQATQQAMQDHQQAVAAAQQAAQQASQNAEQNAMQNTSMDNGPTVQFAQRPKFSVKPGKVDKGTLVRLHCNSRDATIYYTTDNWTPTVHSTVYDGPIRIDRNTHIAAIAIAPYARRSLVATADYTVDGSAPAAPETAISTGDILRAGTPLRLAVTAGTNSKTAEVGDLLKLALDEDVKAGDTVVLKKGTEVTAKIVAFNRAGHGGAPGDLTFVVQSIEAAGLRVPLVGGATIEGADGVGRIKKTIFIPVVGAASIAIRGDEAMIKPGMTLIASVAADTPLHL